MEKTFKSYDELLEHLQKDKHLIICDSEYAKHTLTKTGYFSLISGYKDVFKYPSSRTFKNGTTFEDLYSLYKFDHELRSIFLKYILIAEHIIKSSMAYHFTQLYGENQNEYLSFSHFSVTKSNYSDIQKVIRTLSYHITHKSNYSYITHYKNQYQNVPLWIMIQILTLGQLSHMFDFLKASVPIQICKDHHNISRKDMHSFLSVMAKHRNVCAHGERFFNYMTKDSITDTVFHQKLHISQINSRYENGKNDIFSEVIILKYLLDKEDFRDFYSELNQCIIKKCPGSEILSIMGFPENWQLILHLTH